MSVVSSISAAFQGEKFEKFEKFEYDNPKNLEKFEYEENISSNPDMTLLTSPLLLCWSLTGSKYKSRNFCKFYSIKFN